jgi:hypothetical protein
MIGICVAVAAASIGSPWVDQAHTYSSSDHRRLATMAPYPAGRADDVRRPGFNGRLWIGESIVGPHTTSWPLGWGDPGPVGYGGLDDEFARVYARVGQLVVGMTPWIGIHEGGLSDLEDARNEWLKEQGFVGGVRTFVNDAHLDRWTAKDTRPAAAEELLTSAAGAHAAFKMPEPRATITIPDDVVRIKSKQRVQNDKPAKVVAADAKLAASPEAGKHRSSVKFAVVEPSKPVVETKAAEVKEAAAPAPAKDTTIAKAEPATVIARSDGK